MQVATDSAGVHRKRSYWNDVLKRFSHHKLAMVGLSIIIIEIILVVILPSLAHLNPYAMDAGSGFGAPPSKAHILGTDEVGRDMQALLGDIERGQVDTVLVMNRSHLSRNPLHRNFPCNVISLVEDVKYIAESNRVAAAIRERMACRDERKQAAKGWS